ncbi:MAG: hypothetical protein AAF610_00330 [Pseudomonadota bacterium]
MKSGYQHAAAFMFSLLLMLVGGNTALAQYAVHSDAVPHTYDAKGQTALLDAFAQSARHLDSMYTDADTLSFDGALTCTSDSSSSVAVGFVRIESHMQTDVAGLVVGAPRNGFCAVYLAFADSDGSVRTQRGGSVLVQADVPFKIHVGYSAQTRELSGFVDGQGLASLYVLLEDRFTVNAVGSGVPTWLSEASTWDGGMGTAEHVSLVADFSASANTIPIRIMSNTAPQNQSTTALPVVGAVSDVVSPLQTDPSGDARQRNRARPNARSLTTDTDGDSVLDGADLDDDNDGLLDAREIFAGRLTYGDLAQGDDITGVAYQEDEHVSVRFSDLTFSGAATDLRTGGGLNVPDVGVFDFESILTPAVFFWQADGSDTANNFVEYTITLDGRDGQPTPGEHPVLRIVDLDDLEAVIVSASLGGSAVTATPVFLGPDMVVTGPGAVETTAGPIPAQDSATFATFEFGGSVDTITVRFTSSEDDGGLGLGHGILHVLSFEAGDADRDGLLNSRDLDADNDGVSDLVESGADAASLDPDQNGVIDGAEFSDAGVAGSAVAGNGLADMVESDHGVGNGTPARQSDTDDVADFLDLDSDGDSISDFVEAQTSAGYVAGDGDVRDDDADGDGVIDLFDANDGTTADFGGTFAVPNQVAIDTLDALPDYIDPDSDGDGLSDSDEGGFVAVGTDANNDGIDDATVIGASYADPGGVIDTPLTQFPNTDTDATDVDYRSVNDIDGDGNPDSTDGDDTGGSAADDTLAATPGQTAAIDVLANDDFLPNDDVRNAGTTTLNRASDMSAGNAIGDAQFDADAGTLTYTPPLAEENAMVTVGYEVCNVDPDPDVCAVATVTVSVGPELDMDGDGNPDRLDPNVATPTAAPDTVSADPGVTATFNILDNDDFLANANAENQGTTTLVRAAAPDNGTAAGPFVFNAELGELTYTPVLGEGDTSVTLGYTVCNSAPDPDVCATSTVTINVAPEPDADGDGQPDRLDPNVTLATASDDAVSAAAGDSVVLNVLANDDFLANSDPENEGTTTLAQSAAPNAGTATGIPTFDANTGELTYLVPAAELRPTVTIGYTVCNSEPDPDVCASATVTIVVDALDSDSDGIPDVIEGSVDVDGDGRLNIDDPDSDNDGIPDSVEAGDNPLLPVDTDGDGTPDFEDTDSDNDRVLDRVEAGSTPAQPMDTDGDGRADYVDTDSDNDGTLDVVENTNPPTLAGADSDADGVDDAVDVDQTNGEDTNNNGVDDALEAADADADGVANHLDLDSDNDGVLDLLEAPATPPLGGDVDGDGIDDALDADTTGGDDTNGNGVDDALEPADFDGDGNADFVDTDSDDDGVPDAIEAAANGETLPSLSGNDADGDGVDDAVDPDANGSATDTNANGVSDEAEAIDTDADGLPDLTDLDADSDGITDSIEGVVAGNGQSVRDTDGDAVPDFRDGDSDNDGLTDILEASANALPAGTDDNNDGRFDTVVDSSPRDGLQDGMNGATPTDSDGDGQPDYIDSDSDNDGIFDLVEALPPGTDPATVDANADGFLDAVDPITGLPTALSTTQDDNGNGVADQREMPPAPPPPVITPPPPVNSGGGGGGGAGHAGVLGLLALLAVRRKRLTGPGRPRSV